MKKSILCLLLVILAFSNVPVMAQDAPAPADCDLPALQKLIDTTVEALTTLKAQTDPKQVLGDLQVITGLVGMYRSACDGLVFSGKEGELIGPITIPAGIYRAIATTKGFIIAKVTAISGECGAGSRGSSEHLFSLSAGEADAGSETLFTSKGCDALIEISLTDVDWQLAFEIISSK